MEFEWSRNERTTSTALTGLSGFVESVRKLDWSNQFENWIHRISSKIGLDESVKNSICQICSKEKDTSNKFEWGFVKYLRKKKILWISLKERDCCREFYIQI